MIKRCKTCGHRLSIYNENEYCFAHLLSGLVKEEADKFKRHADSVKKNYRRKMEMRNETK